MLTRRKALALMSVSALALPRPASGFMRGGVSTGSAGPGTLGFFQMLAGDGGLTTGLDIQPNGTMLLRNNTLGVNRYDASAPNPGNAGGLGVWTPIVTSLSMPPGSFGPNAGAVGGYEGKIAPSQTTTFYMSYFGLIYVSTNSGGAWALTNFPQNTNSFGAGNIANSGNCGNGPFIAIDPINPNVVWAGSPGSQTGGGLYSTTGGTTGGSWSLNGTVPASANFGGNNIGVVAVVFDPTSAQSGGKTQGLYAGSSGTGIYHSTNAGTSWTNITGSGPNTVGRMVCDTAGVLWVLDQNFHLWRWKASTWAQVLTNNGYFQFAVDPVTPQHVFAAALGSGIAFSTDGGNTWSSESPQPNIRVATDVPWLAVTNEVGMGGGDLQVDYNGKLWLMEGIGVWTCPTATIISNNSASQLTFTSVSSGVEMLVGKMVLWPAGGKPVGFHWDRPPLYFSDFTKYPTTIGYGSACPEEIMGSWVGDWASSLPSTIVGIINSNNDGFEMSGISTDSGQTWTPFGQSGCHNSNLGTNLNFYPGVSSGTYNSGTGAVSLTLSGPLDGGVAAGGHVVIAGISGTGSVASLNGTWLLTAGSSSTTINFTAPTGLTLTIASGGGQNAQVSFVFVWTGVPAGLPNAPGDAVTFFQTGNVANSAVIIVTSYSGTTMAGSLSKNSGNYTAGSISDWFIHTVPPAIANNNLIKGSGIAASTPSNIVWVPGYFGVSPSYTTDGGITWNDLASYFNSNFGITQFDGWQGNQSVAADRVTANLFYLVNVGTAAPGFYVSTNGGATWSKKVAGTPAANAYGNGVMVKAVPGNAGIVFICGPSDNFIWSKNANAVSGVTFSQVSTFNNVVCFGFGKAAPGKSYPAIYVSGNLGGVWGLYQSIDSTATAIGTFQLLATWPANNFYQTADIDASKDTYGQLVIALGGNGYIRGNVP